jgi:ethanolamine utilization protein EutP (predicted NTPase)
MIHGVVPRKTFLRRKSPGKTVDFQTIAANVDAVFVVQACGADFNPARLDRCLAMAAEGAVEPRVLLTKTDLIPPGELERAIGCVRNACASARVLALSNTTGTGLEEFRALLVPGETCCLLGSSGVGKTTLINRPIGRDMHETRAVSATGEGVHTTVRRQLLLPENGTLLQVWTRIWSGLRAAKLGDCVGGGSGVFWAKQHAEETDPHIEVAWPTGKGPVRRETRDSAQPEAGGRRPRPGERAGRAGARGPCPRSFGRPRGRGAAPAA